MNDQSEQISMEEQEKIFAAAYAGTDVPVAENADSTKSEPVVEKKEEVEGKESNEEADAGSAKQPEDSAPEWYKVLPQEAKQELDRLSQERDRAAEHARTQQGRLKKAEQEKRELEARLQSVKPPEKPAVQSDSEFDKLLKEIESADEGLARAIRLASEQAVKQATAQQAQEIEQLKTTYIAPVQARQHDSYLEEQARILDQHVSNWREIVAHPVFNEYIETLPAAVRGQLVNSPHAEDVSYLLEGYGGYVERRFPTEQKQATKGGDPNAERIAKERADKLKNSVAPVTNKAAPKQTQETEEQILQAEFLKGFASVPGYYNSKARS